MDEWILNSLLRETSAVAASGKAGSDTADSVLEQLQAAVNEHSRILHQQELLIRQLREQLREVEK